MYGAAEAIGLMLARVCGLPEEAQPFVRTQARAMQYITFLYDLGRNMAMGRCYFSVSEYRKYGLKDITEHEAREKPKMFEDFMHAQLLRYATWQAEATEQHIYVTKRLRVYLQAIVAMQTDAAQRLKNDPLLAYEQSTLQIKNRDLLQQLLRRASRTNS